MQVNVIIRGQSNSALLGSAANMQLMRADIERLLGFDGVANSVNILGGPGITEFSGTTLVPSATGVPSWLNGGAPSLRAAVPSTWAGEAPTPSAAELGAMLAAVNDPAAIAAEAAHPYADGPMQATLLSYVHALPADQRAAPTATLWVHNESDSQNASLTSGDFAAGVRFAMAEERAALGQDAATTPVVFLEVPYDWGPGGIEMAGLQNVAQAVKIAELGLTQDASFNASSAASMGDANMDGTDPYLGGQHFDATDAATAVARAAVSIAAQFAQYALPGSPAAVAGGTLDAAGPQAVDAQGVQGHPDQVLVRIAVSAVTGPLGALSPAAMAGAGWQVRDGATVLYGRAATLVDDGQALLVSLTGAVPADGQASLFYGYGPGRIFAETAHPNPGSPEAAGQGAAVYDAHGMPLSETPLGLAVAPRSAGVAGVPQQTIVAAGAATIAAASGQDELVFSGASSSLVFLGGGGVHTVVGGSGDLYASGQEGRITAWGSSGSDTLVGGAAGSNTIVGGAGNATIVGAGDDLLCAGAAASDIVVGGGANVVFGSYAASGDVTIHGGAGDDEYVAAQGRTLILAGTGRDTIWGSSTAAAACVVAGGSGADLLVGGHGSDTVMGGTGFDTLVGGSGTQDLRAGSGQSLMFSGEGRSSVSLGGAGSASTVVGGAGQVAIMGHGGTDVVFAGSGPLSMSTGAGHETVVMDPRQHSSSDIGFGSGTATVWDGGGAVDFSVTRGQAGGSDVICGFRPGTDHLALVGYGAADERAEPLGQAAAGAGTTMRLSDGTSITLIWAPGSAGSTFT